MKCTKLMTFALIISMIFPSSIFAQSTCTVCESDKIVVEADEAEAFENDLKQKVETLNGKESGITYKYTYTVKTRLVRKLKLRYNDIVEYK